jgi:hypothetical protein
MKIVFIYGAPSVGKLSVAEELTRMTGFLLFHNHLTLDEAEHFYKWGTPEFWNFVTQKRLVKVADAARENQKGIIMTYVYQGSQKDDEYIDELKKMATLVNSKIYFVELICDLEELKKRVISPSRLQYKKINSVDMLVSNLSKSVKTGGLKADLSIDNTLLDPVSVATKISFQFSL